MTDVIVAGGGAAGLMAACQAARQGAEVLLLERNEKAGRKLGITGKGRCNVTNHCAADEVLRHVPTNPKFLYSCLRGFDPAAVMAFFEELGVPLKTERGNRVFPVSDRAQDVVGALAAACRHAGVRRETERVTALLREGNRVCGVRCESGREERAGAVILATGGYSYPMTGSDGDGYRLAAECGHTLTEIRPSLVPLVSRDECCADLQGLSLRNVELSLWDARNTGKGRTPKPVFRELGEMLFTHYGMSGPLVLSASAHIRPFAPERWRVELDLKPGLAPEQLDARLLRDFGEFSNRDFCNSLEKLLPRKMIPVVVLRSGIPPFTKVHDVTREQRQRLVGLLKHFSVTVDGFRPIEEAIITSGGVCVQEVDPKTMASRICEGLYFAGEILDVDGYTGGFNLQIAWSTGTAAGRAAARAAGREKGIEDT